MNLVDAELHVSGDGNAVLRYLNGDKKAKVDTQVILKVATLRPGPGRKHGFREKYSLPAISNGEPEETFRALGNLARQALISAQEEARIGDLVRRFAETLS